MTADKKLGFFDYLGEAFHRRHRVPGLGNLRLNWGWLALNAVLGLANPGFWFLGAAGEIAYLVLSASSPRFQKVVDAKRRHESQQDHEERVQRAFGRLGRESQQRYRRLHQQAEEIVRLSETLGETNLDSLGRLRTGTLGQLLWLFLRLLTSRELLLQTLETTDRADVAAEISRLQQRLEPQEGEDSQLARSLRQSLEIQRRRLENLDRVEANLELLDVELARIEQQVTLIREESAVMGKAEALSERLDAVTGALQETNRWLEQHSELFGIQGLEPPTSAELPTLTPPAPEAEGQS